VSQAPSFNLLDDHHDPDDLNIMPTSSVVSPPKPKEPVGLRRFGDVDATRKAIYDNVFDAASKMKPVSNNKHTLHLKDVKWTDGDVFTKKQRKEATLKGDTLGRRLHGTWVLSDNESGKELDRRSMTIAKIPHLTEGGTFVHNGNEYAITNQARLLSGAFAREKENGEIETHANVLSGGPSHRYWLDPEKGRFFLKVQNANVPLLPLLKTMGASDDEIRSAWGNDLHRANIGSDNGQAMVKIKDKILHGKVDGSLDAAVKKAFEGMTLDPEVTKHTLGHPHARLDKDAMLAITKKLLAVSRHEAEPDDRDHLAYQTFLGPEDLFRERLEKDRAGVRRQLLYKMGFKGNLQSMPHRALQKQVESALLESGLGKALEEINPAEILDKNTQISRMGEGGIPSYDAIPDEARAVQPSHFGFIDPLRTPECYDADTEVMTYNGWRRWADVDPETAVFACLVDGRLAWHVPMTFHVHDYDGPMFGVESDLIAYMVTPNHRVWSRPGDFKCEGLPYRIDRADAVHGKDRKFMCGGHLPYRGDSLAGTFNGWFTVPEPDRKGQNNRRVLPAIAADDWYEFLGWYLGEGNVSIQRDKGRYVTIISQSLTANPANCRRIEALLARMPFAWRYNRHCRGFVISGKHLAEYLEQFGFSEAKFLPDDVWEAPIEARRRLLESLLLGEGRRNHKGERSQFCSTSVRLAEDVHRLAFSLGKASRVVTEPENQAEHYYDVCVVHLHERQERRAYPKTRGGGSHHFVRPYAGKVYCASVPGGLLYVRRNGKTGLWSGNSFKAGVDTFLAGNARKGSDGKLYGGFTDLATGKTVWKTPQDIAETAVTFPGAMNLPGKRVPAMKAGKLTWVKKQEATLALPHFEHAFSPLDHFVPLKSMLKGQRASMASRMSTQALPMVDGEAPLVQNAMPGTGGTRSYEDEYGEHMGAMHAKKGGRVLGIDKDGIKVRHDDGTTETHELYDNHPYNRKSVTGDTRVMIKRKSEIYGCGFTLWEGPIREYSFFPDRDDRVLSIDPLTKKSAWMRVLGFIKHENDKQLLRIKTASGREVVVTEDHSLMTMGADGNLVPIFPVDCEVGKTRLPVARIPETQVQPYPGKDRDYGRLVGLYLAEGDRPAGQLNLIRIAVEPDDRAVEVMTLLSRFDEGNAPYRSVGRVCVTAPKLAEKLAKDFGCGSENKTIPSRFLRYPREFREGLIEGYMAGDGCLNADGNGAIQVCATSVSKLLRDGLVDVLSSLGVFVSMFDAPRQHLNENWRDGYAFRVISGHLNLLPRWFFYTDRDKEFRRLLRLKYRSSPFELVPVHSTREAREVLYDGFRGKVPVYVHKTAQQGAVAKHRIAECSGPFGKWGRSDVMWDEIISIEQVPHESTVYDLSVDKSEAFAVCHGLVVHNTGLTQTPVVQPGDRFGPGQLLAHSNFTDKNGTSALGLNARVAYLPWGGKNFEDANVISESMAKRMTSEHMYQHGLEVNDRHKMGKKPYLSLFPGKFDKRVLETLDDKGVVKPGTIVKHGDPLIVAAEQREHAANKIHKQRQAPFADASILWKHHDDGIVTDVLDGKDGPVVMVKSHHPMQVGDKMSGRYGDKGIVSAIVPDEHMPHDKNGKPFEVLLNPLGVISRTNPAQWAEAKLGAIAEKTGRPFKAEDWDPAVSDRIAWVENLMRQHGLPDTEDIVDPATGHKIPNVYTGNRFFMKLHHTAESKGQGRSGGSYSADETPAKGGETGSKRISMLDTNALLSHGATQVLRDAGSVRGQKNDDYWLQFMQGFTPRKPRIPMVYEKFINELKASGINVVRDGSQLHIMALTNKDVDKLAEDRDLKHGDTVHFDKGLEPVKGGLFDKELTGGHHGTRWSAIALNEAMPNPVMEEPIRRVLGLTRKQFEGVLSGEHHLGHETGPKAIAKALDSVDLDAELARARNDVQYGTKTKRDDAVRKLGYLKSAKQLGIHPGDWMMSRVPVLPPQFRPVSVMGSNNIPLVSDPNFLYKELHEADKNLGEMKKHLGDGGVGAERLAVYQAFKAVSGLGEPITQQSQDKQVKGILKSIFGSSPKFGTVQRKLISSTVDNVGRAVISPNPDLDMDSVGLPEDRAYDVYQRFVVRRLRRQGMPLVQALQEVKDQTGRARNALNEEMQERPVIINRAPVLHRYGIMAFRPQLTKGSTLQVSPLIVKGFNADFDGDAMQYHVPTDEAARVEALARMLPSKSLLSPGDFKTPVHVPGQEYVGGLYSASTAKSKRPVRTFRSKADVLAAWLHKEIDVGDAVKILQDTKR
jgi:DNA-directed RNA polymerase beta subunit